MSGDSYHQFLEKNRWCFTYRKYFIQSQCAKHPSHIGKLTYLLHYLFVTLDTFKLTITHCHHVSSSHQIVNRITIITKNTTLNIRSTITEPCDGKYYYLPPVMVSTIIPTITTPPSTTSTEQLHNNTINIRTLTKAGFPLGGILRAERNFSLSCDFSSGTN
jgi:hypothetical protein